MSRRQQMVLTVAWCVSLMCGGFSATADEGTTVGVHYGLSGVIAKVQSGLLFVKTPQSLQSRAISPMKADRVGLHEAKTGEVVVMWVDSGNVLLDIARADQLFANHRIITGTLGYADPYWREIRISTPEGFERFEVDALAGSKLSVFQEGTPVAVELDADNMMIDIHRSR